VSNERRRGRFITIEGIEGAGKSTAVDAVRRWHETRGLAVDCTREPGGTPTAEAIRAILVTPAEDDPVPETELLLMFAARAQHVARRIKPALAEGWNVVCDRFTDSSRAYQGAGRDMDREDIEDLARIAQQGLEPDLTLLLDLPVSLGLSRARQRAELAGAAAATDRFERETTRFFERVRQEFLDLAERHPRRFAVIDAARSLDEVATEIHAALDRHERNIGGAES